MSLTAGRVLLTGASGGIGHAIARALAADGAQLLLTGRRAEVLEPLAEELGGRATACDLAVRGEVERLAAEAVAWEPQVLVANAALPASGVFTSFTQEEIDRMLEVNLRAPIALARALAPGMVSRGHGHIVLISSLAGKAASPASSIYSATKFGLRGFALAAREDLGPQRVGVSVVLPGFIRDAGMFADARVKLPRGVGTRAPQEVAAAVLEAIRSNRAEVEVAPLGLRVGAAFASLAPELASRVSRRLGSSDVAANVASGQQDKR